MTNVRVGLLQPDGAGGLGMETKKKPNARAGVEEWGGIDRKEKGKKSGD